MDIKEIKAKLSITQVLAYYGITHILLGVALKKIIFLKKLFHGNAMLWSISFVK
jgi:hypothetical protein